MFIDSMRSMIASISLPIDKISEIDRKIMLIDEKEPENKFIDTMGSMSIHYHSLLIKHQRFI